MKPLLAFFAIVFSFTSFAQTEIETLTFLHTDGHYIVNEQNDTILFRGVGLGNWLLPEGYMWRFGKDGDRPRKIEKLILEMTDSVYAKNFWENFRQNYITERDIIKIRELGLNTVRPALNARVFLTEGDTAVFIEENFKLLDNLVNWCRKHGLYVILDMHGAPGGQTGQNIDDSPNNLPELFMDPIYEHRLTRLWLKLVERYKDEPVIAGYDLLNEPLPEKTGAAEKYKHMLEPMYKRLTKAIREIDKKHIIILEGYDWSNNWSIFGEPFDDNLIYQFHYYCWDNPEVLKDIDYYIKERERLNVPVWVGETGERNARIYWGTTQLFEHHNIGWSFWPWKKLDTDNGLSGIIKPEGWELIADYSRGKDKPDKETAKKILDDYLANIPFEKCEYLENISNAVLRKAPVTIEAVNYGHEGFMNSYYVKDTSCNSDYYRVSEPVKINLIKDDEEKWNKKFFVALDETEWLAYSVFSDFEKNYHVQLNFYQANNDQKFSFFLNGKLVLEKTLNEDQSTIDIESIRFSKGENELKIKCDSESINIINFDVK